MARLEVLSAAGSRSAVPSIDLDDAATIDPAILAFDDLMSGSLARVSAAAGKIGGKVLEATKIVEEAFTVQKDLLVKAKQCQVGHLIESSNSGGIFFMICGYAILYFECWSIDDALDYAICYLVRKWDGKSSKGH